MKVMSDSKRFLATMTRFGLPKGFDQIATLLSP
jgi:hypothetical protein